MDEAADLCADFKVHVGSMVPVGPAFPPFAHPTQQWWGIWEVVWDTWTQEQPPKEISPKTQKGSRMLRIILRNSVYLAFSPLCIFEPMIQHAPTYSRIFEHTIFSQLKVALPCEESPGFRQIKNFR